MILALSSFKAVILAFGIAASAIMTTTQTCQKLEGRYQANVDVVGAALQAFQRCASTRTDPISCSTETHELITAQEELQAVFGDYLKTCGSRVAGRGITGEAQAAWTAPPAAAI
jgi:hypothetical protein